MEYQMSYDMARDTKITCAKHVHGDATQPEAQCALRKGWHRTTQFLSRRALPLLKQVTCIRFPQPQPPCDSNTR
eukprot:7684745-Pyramimonas_sp.AAC.1